MKRKWLGDKTGQGFYKKARGGTEKVQRLVLDVATFEYRPVAKAALPSLEWRKMRDAGERLKVLLANDSDEG